MARKDHSYDSGRIHRAGGDSYSAPRSRTRAKPAKMKKAKRKGSGAKKALIAILIILVLGVGSVFGLVTYFDARYLSEGQLGQLDEDVALETLKGHFNILLVGIDYEEGRTHALTDMIMYISYDTNTNSATMMQIPRDSWVGYEYSADGKINAAMSTGPDKDNKINNLARIFSEQYQLPVNYYIGLDMDSMRSIMDILGPLYVYVPKSMSYKGSSLEQGWRWLDANAAEFFVRNRMGEGMERADIDRLDNQRYFYSALFRRFLNLTPSDLASLLPVLEYYCDTNFTVGRMGDLLKLGRSALDLDVQNIIMFRAPGATGVNNYPNYYVLDLYGDGTEENLGMATLMNTYLRDEGNQVSAEALAAGKFPAENLSGYSLYPANVQGMTEIQDDEGGADINVEPGQ